MELEKKVNANVLNEIDNEEMKSKILKLIKEVYEMGLNNGYLNAIKGITEIGAMLKNTK
jgi:hypothetical protein